jgi:hypothetical protein
MVVDVFTDSKNSATGPSLTRKPHRSMTEQGIYCDESALISPNANLRVTAVGGWTTTGRDAGGRRLELDLLGYI